MSKIGMYKNYHKSHSLWGGGALHFQERLVLLIEELCPKSILDYGCGKGALVSFFREKYSNITVCGYDPAVKEYEQIPHGKFDFITCCDVLEHIPEEELIDTVKKISTLSENVFFVLHHGPAEAVLESGENAHCTIKPPEWYYDVLKRFFSKIHYLPAEHGYNTVCITFDISNKTELGYYRLTERLAKQENLKMMTRNKLLRELFKVNWADGFCTSSNLVLYGFGYNCRMVYDVIKNKCKIRCFCDSKKNGYYDDIPIINIKDFRPCDGDVIVVFPEYDFDKIRATLLPSVNKEVSVIKASDFFTSHLND